MILVVALIVWASRMLVSFVNHFVSEEEEGDASDHEADDKDEQEQGEGAGGRTLILARITIEHGAALAFALLAHAAILAVRVAFLVLEPSGLLHNHIAALNDRAKGGPHLKLQDHEVVIMITRHHILWESDGY